MLPEGNRDFTGDSSPLPFWYCVRIVARFSLHIDSLYNAYALKYFTSYFFHRIFLITQHEYKKIWRKRISSHVRRVREIFNDSNSTEYTPYSHGSFEGKLPTTIASWERNSSRDRTPRRANFSLSFSLHFSLRHVQLRIFARIKGSFERESKSRNQRVYYENRYTHVCCRRITGFDGVHLPKHLNYQDRRVHPLVRASSSNLS